MRPWRMTRTSLAADFKFFKVHEDWLISPRTGQEAPFYAIDCPDWVVIVAIEEGGQLLMVRQWRFGARETTLELAGGVIDEGESPEAAAHRELREETGYGARTMKKIGVVHPNPANQRNRCHVFLATGCMLQGSLDLDEGEDIEVARMPFDKVRQMIAAGEIGHALVVAAIYLHDLEMKRDA